MKTGKINFDKYRKLFPINNKYVFFNHAAISPVSINVSKAVSDFYTKNSNHASSHYFEWIDKVKDTKKIISKLLNACYKEIAFTQNTSHGLSIIASGFLWKPGDVVMVPVPDFPSNIYPWMHLEAKGVNIKYVNRIKGRLNVDILEKALHPKTRMITLSSVDYATGYMADLYSIGNFCKEKGIFFCVDAIQSLGVIPMDVKKFNIDFLSAGSHKWLMGPMGVGFLYVANKSINMIRPPIVGWKSVEDEENFTIDFKLKRNALVFEPGTLNFSGIFGLYAALKLIDEIIPEISEKIFSLQNILFDELKNRKFETNIYKKQKNRSGILTFTPKGNPEDFFSYLLQNNIIVSLRNGKIRIAPHFYNNEKDINIFLKTIDKRYF